MGCISSKIITRSTSYQEELNHSFQKKDNNGNNSNGLPSLEELFISRNGGTSRDQFLARLVSSAAAANTTTSTTLTLKKLQSGKFSTFNSERPPVDKDILKLSVNPMNTDDNETINSWELMAGLEEDQDEQHHHQQQHQQEQILLSSRRDELESIHHHPITKTRSKSFHWFVEHNSSSSILEGSYSRAKDGDHGSNRDTTTTTNNNEMGIPRSRSFHFHTLQEYDEMVAERKKWLIEAQEKGNSVRDTTKVQNSYPNCGTYALSKTCDHLVDEEEESRVREPIERKEDAIKKDDRLIEEDLAPASNEAADKSKNSKVIETNMEDNAFAAHGTSSSISAIDVVEDALSKGNLLTSEKGLRRKALVKELTLLSIPMSPSPTLGFLGSLRERLDHDEVLRSEQEQVYNYYSSEAYVTPKFGSFYSLPPILAQTKKCSSSSNSSSDDSAVFESEMVAAFEEAMQQLQVEEDCVLKQIGENLDHEDYGIHSRGGVPKER